MNLISQLPCALIKYPTHAEREYHTEAKVRGRFYMKQRECEPSNIPDLPSLTRGREPRKERDCVKV